MFELSFDADNNINLDIKGHGKQTIRTNLPYELVEATDKAISQGKAKVATSLKLRHCGTN